VATLRLKKYLPQRRKERKELILFFLGECGDFAVKKIFTAATQITQRINFIFSWRTRCLSGLEKYLPQYYKLHKKENGLNYYTKFFN